MTPIKFFTLTFLASFIFAFTSCSSDDDSCNETLWYADNDSDGFGNANDFISSCDQPENYVANSTDINDNNANLNPNTVWQGEKITFSKSNNADWTLEANQDRITNNVWITRANNQGIFNIATETNYTDFSSPSDTEWALGTTSSIEGLTFQNWEDTSGSTPPNLVDQDMVVHLISDNIYIDIKFTSWQSGGQGGGFSYERSSSN
ncbi:MAG: hypothetical protein BM564_13065 [Bacteroidetes bacterium MedPE-SWsnd-G2]|nr:MAG: hypothetical protein BM564_13065 [Bacteroidetes bacterium MedPE-SWsnd-G2]